MSTDITKARGFNVSGTGVNLNTGKHLILPQVNEPATPTLSFGDGDTGFYENADDSISVAIAGVLKFQFLPDFFSSGVTGGGALKTSAASATVPAILFAGDADTGLGTAGADILSLIAGGVEGIRIEESGGVIGNSIGGKVKFSSLQTLTGAGAVDLTSSTTHIVSTGVNALTLADGDSGQIKFIIMKTDAGDATLTPTNPGNFATIVFNDVGDSAQLLFTNGKWHFMGGTATLA